MSRHAKEPDPSTLTGQVAAEIRRRRLQKKLSVEEAAAAALAPATTWYRWEKGEGLPLTALSDIARVLDCTPRQLLPPK